MKKRSDFSRLMGYAGGHRVFTYASLVLSAVSALMALLPFRSLAITGMKDLPGIYVTILASEDRSKELRQRRPSVRRQLKQEPRPAEKPEKKSPIYKKKEPER